MNTTKLISLLCLTFLGIFVRGTAQNINIVERSKMTFPGQTIGNVCGYAANGREYALLGGSKGLIIVDVTDPDAPLQIAQLSGPDNLWKEIKTYGHYAYTTSEGGLGLHIADLSNLPSANIPERFYTGDGAIAGQLNTIHALHIDVTKGFLYAYGSNIPQGGAIILNLNPDPYNPTYAGNFSDLGYIHDGYVDNDTLYGGHIGSGFFSIVDMTNKNAPQILATQTTPNNFTHNTWLSTDRKTLFTTDETANSFLASYDISDPEDVKFLDKIQSNPGSNSVVHNTHILNNYAVTAWYRDGVTIVDVTRPQNMVQVGNFDTYPQGTGAGFDGCWGVYPYLPSGNLIASTIDPGEMYVLTPTYERACYLEGQIVDASNGNPLNNASIQLINQPGALKTSNNLGQYAIGQLDAGAVELLVTRTGYTAKTATAILEKGVVTNLDIELEPVPSYLVTGKVTRAGDGAPVANAKISLVSNQIQYDAESDANGEFNLPQVFANSYQALAGAWGYRYKTLDDQLIENNTTLEFELEAGYEDDFMLDYGWSSSGSSFGGRWERGEPLGIDFGLPFLLAPDFDVEDDLGDQCYVTGNQSDFPDEDDVESGNAVLISPFMNLSEYINPRISFKLWALSVNQSFQFPDSVKIYVGNGAQEKLAIARKADFPTWTSFSIDVTDFVPLSNSIRIRVVARDNPLINVQDSYEAALDQFKVTDQPLATGTPTGVKMIQAAPNPFRQDLTLSFEALSRGSQLMVYDLTGRLVEIVELPENSGQVQLGQAWQQGVYLVRLIEADGSDQTIRLVKLD